MSLRIAIASSLLLAGAGAAYGQAVRALPYSAQLATDPAVGNVQGIQRYGRALRTDPDEGEGFSYHVYPVAEPPMIFQAGDGYSLAGAAPIRTTAASDGDGEIEDLKRRLSELQSANQQESAQYTQLKQQLRVAKLERELAAFQTAAAFGAPAPLLPYPEPFDATAGLRNYATPYGPPGELNLLSQMPGLLGAKAFDPKTKTVFDIYHQPLIQVKVRVIEVVRADGLAVQSVLDYVSRDGNDPSLITGNNINNNRRNLRGATRFDVPGLLQVSGMGLNNGAGALINLTSEHINYIASFLASELNGDIVTAPEVITLNGQNVEFVAGTKLPFELGQNVIQGTNNNIQQFFYKHVGTYVSVTPKIVNFGFHGEGEGEAPIVASDVFDWNGLIEIMLDRQFFELPNQLRDAIVPYAQNTRPVPFGVRSDILRFLSDYRKTDTQCFLHLAEEGLIDPCVCDNCRIWKPENCTIDLSIVVRLSEPGQQTITQQTGDQEQQVTITTAEKNVRAVANIIQIKSGNGVVMAGLIGEREEEALDKTPILGDIPVVGFLFRSKEVLRQKTEILVFVEAEVLPPEANHARAQSADDFLLGRGYVDGELLDNPLEYGLYRVGFGSYLPPHTHAEEIFWERCDRRVRKIQTHLDDALK